MSGSDFKFNCPHCNQRLEVDIELRGSHVPCPACLTELVVPDSRSIASASARSWFGSSHSPPTRKRSSGLGQIIGGVIFLGITIVMATMFSRSIAAQRATSKWPSVNGTLVESAVGSERSGMKSRTTTYRPVVNYQFVVNGRRYAGRRIAYAGRGFNSPDAVEEFLQNLSNGQSIKVFYNPKDPHQAVLVSGIDSGLVGVVVAVNGLFGVMAFCLIFFGTRGWLGERPANIHRVDGVHGE